ncbi:MAG: hypothetical protein WC812_03140 [Candidatus Pacearchaeota archaeon]|jgi:hypothetical protein
MKNLFNTKKNREHKKILYALMKSNSDVRFVDRGKTYMGKIKKLTDNEIILKPYLTMEPFPGPRGYIDRIRMEEEIGVALPITAQVERLGENYIIEFMLSSNYFQWKTLKNTPLEKVAFKGGYPFPNEEGIKFLEGKSEKESPKNKIGFQFY